MAKSKEPVRLRQRLMASGNTSLYLDIYVNGKRNYEYLNLYLIPEVSRSDKAKNKETMRLEKARVFDPFGHAGFDPSGKIRLTP